MIKTAETKQSKAFCRIFYRLHGGELHMKMVFGILLALVVMSLAGCAHYDLLAEPPALRLT